MRTKQVVAHAFAGLFVFGLCAAPAAAQTEGLARRPVTFDVVGGMNLATMTVPTSEFIGLFQGIDIEMDVSRRAGFAGGVLVGVPLGGTASFETGALLSVKGVSVTVTLPGFGTSTGHIRMTYLDVPALVRLRVVTTPQGPVSLLAGPTIGVRLHATTSSSFMGQTASESFTDEVTPIDIGLTVGGRVELGRALVDVRYTHGLRNSAKDTGVGGEPPTPPSIKHRVISFMAGWRF